MAAHTRAGERGIKVIVARPTPNIAELLKITGLDQVITLQRSTDV